MATEGKNFISSWTCKGYCVQMPNAEVLFTDDENQDGYMCIEPVKLNTVGSVTVDEP